MMWLNKRQTFSKQTRTMTMSLDNGKSSKISRMIISRTTTIMARNTMIIIITMITIRMLRAIQTIFHPILTFLNLIYNNQNQIIKLRIMIMKAKKRRKINLSLWMILKLKKVSNWMKISFSICLNNKYMFKNLNLKRFKFHKNKMNNSKIYFNFHSSLQ